MIKQAATRPTQRRKDIMEGVTHLKWAEDPCLLSFGIKVNSNMVVTKARLLKNPEVTFANGKINPGVSGRWDLRGKKFLEPNPTQLKSWSFVCCGGGGKNCGQGDMENFARQFSQTYRNHGGNIANPALVISVPFGDGDYSKICADAWNRTGNHFQMRPQMIFFVVPTKNILVYERIKKSMDCRFNIPSQVLWGNHVKKCQGQYMSNVAMKVNAKLGGVTCKVAGPTKDKPPFWQRPTAVIGVDVSHGGAGTFNPSMAALTMSMDRHGTRYAAACEVNGWRTECLLQDTTLCMLPKLVRHWKLINATIPQHIYYIRDGVSEGQFSDVLEKEVNTFKRVFREADCGEPKFTVIIATKRHHVRFFPKPNDKATGDKNGNPLPGTLVEKDVTHPQHYDFYLCSHVAIQGTARPVHYQVILDEAGVKPNDLQRMIYQQCYQYCRSTTPVSLHPAVYYSHLASNRARAHEGIDSDQLILEVGKPGFPYGKEHEEIYTPAQKAMPQPAPLLGMHNKNTPPDLIRFMNTTMWFV